MLGLARCRAGPSLARCLWSSAVRRAVLEIKDEEEFQKKVIESTVPVLVDFHATYEDLDSAHAPVFFLYAHLSAVGVHHVALWDLCWRR